VVDALTVLQARRIGLVSPYPAGLNEASVAYWRSHGFDPVEIASVFNTESAFHPIYSLEGSAATKALRSLEGKPLDAIVMLGTGMPTLAPIAEPIGWFGAPAMSCNLCLAWRVIEALDGNVPSAATLKPWLRGEGWVGRLKAQMQL
jgi:maleate cis-trans isomerase